jgi:glycosyltransferase involved in cell wall biosynthesis
MNNDPAKSVLIENSVDVDDIPKHKPNNGGVCCALRFSSDQMQPHVLDLFAGLSACTYIYGFDDGLSFDPVHNARIVELANNYDNVDCLPYCNYLEWQMTRHSFFAYYLHNSNPNRSYGLVALEAIALGMPVVALRKRQPGQQYLIHGYNGFIADTDEEFTKYCAALLDDKSLYISVCDNSAIHAASIKNCMPGRYRALYESLL